MKTFALALLAATVLGRATTGIEKAIVSQTIDLTNSHANQNGYTVAIGETLEFILAANPSTGYSWDYDETIIDDGLFKVKSTYKQDESCGQRMRGCGGAQHIKIIAGKDEGEATFFACKTRGTTEVRYDVMANWVGISCETINIHVRDVTPLREVSNNLA